MAVSASPPSPSTASGGLSKESSQKKRSRIDNSILCKVSRVGVIDETSCNTEPAIVDVRCVTEFDNMTENCPSFTPTPSKLDVPPPLVLPNPLKVPISLEFHSTALQLEAELHPMRLILSRLMSNLSYNRKGIFNFPVDALALGLFDYSRIVKEPMDLGTVKTRLHCVFYESQRHVADDIRLCFRNAMLFNPPTNNVHLSAKQLLSIFEDHIKSFCPGLASPDSLVIGPSKHNDSPAEVVTLSRKRRKRGTKNNPLHKCQACIGANCAVCNQGCLSLEPTLLICNGPQCSGARIRKGSAYYITPDGSSQYCARCHLGLSAILPQTGTFDAKTSCRYKNNMLRRKNDEEIVERWVTCSACACRVHEICAMQSSHIAAPENYKCAQCSAVTQQESASNSMIPVELSDMYSFVSGSAVPVPVSRLLNGIIAETKRSASDLKKTSISSFIEAKVRDCVKNEEFPNSEKTVTVRVISDVDRNFSLPQVIREHFKMATSCSDSGDSITPPLQVHYRSKAIALFQKIDGIDVFIFCMYVHEYDCEDIFDREEDGARAQQNKRVYIAYLDSVEHFRPRARRTAVYQEMLTAYLATARLRGYENAHIWACPPSRGNSFVFWNHPESQRTPNMERLTAWYHGALSKAVSDGIVSNIRSVYETNFEDCAYVDHGEGKPICPPILEGDFWVEEAVRLHENSIARHCKAFGPNGTPPQVHPHDILSPCPAVQICSVLVEKILSNPISLPFRQPVNASALKLKNYHEIVTNPMDLGTLYSRCLHGEYPSLDVFVDDFNLVVTNAQSFNPPGHPVHMKASELSNLFFDELNSVTSRWNCPGCTTWRDFGSTSMRLDTELKHFKKSSLHTTEDPATSQCDSDGITTKDDIKMKNTPTSSPPTSLFSHTPKDIMKLLVGDDVWLLDKNPSPPKNTYHPKKSRKNPTAQHVPPPPSRKQQCWLGMELRSSVRKMRASLFCCSLTGESVFAKSGLFDAYVNGFDIVDQNVAARSIADCRHSFIEFSQYRNLEFDTLRKAKYSSSVLLYHLHAPETKGIVPSCTSCSCNIKGVRWHRASRVVEIKPQPNTVAAGKSARKRTSTQQPLFEPADVCADCYDGDIKGKDEFIPISVAFQS